MSLLAIAAAATTMTSCVKEQLCFDTEGDVSMYDSLMQDHLDTYHVGKVNFKYDWNNITSHGMQVPDSMFVLVDRVIFQNVGSLALETKTETGKILAPFTKIRPAVNSGIKDFDIYAGEYKFLTVNYSSTNFNYAEMQNLMTKTLSNHMSNVSIAYNSYKKGQKKNGELILDEPENWMDANQYTRPDGTPCSFVLTESAPVVIDSTTITKWEANETKTINFKPTTITQNIDIFFDIKKDVSELSFEVDSVYAVISGIPHRVNLGTGGLDISDTDKMIFRTDLVNPNVVPDEKTQPVKDTPSNTKVRCFKNVTVLGIVENELAETDLYAGPGVMQLIIYNKVYNTDGTVTYRTVTGMVNIHKSLLNAKLQLFDPDLQLYHKTREHSDLYISIDVTLSKSNILGTDDGGIVKWNEQTIPSEFEIY